MLIATIFVNMYDPFIMVYILPERTIHLCANQSLDEIAIKMICSFPVTYKHTVSEEIDHNVQQNLAVHV